MVGIPWFVAGTVWAQGTIQFSTLVPGSVNARVTRAEAPVGSAYLGQLYAAFAGGALGPVGRPLPFRDDAAIGYITGGGDVVVVGVAAGGSAHVKLVAWDASMGDSYDAAVERGSGRPLPQQK